MAHCFFDNNDGTITVSGIGLVSSLFGELLDRYSNSKDADFFARLTGAVNQARYEAELQAMGDYPGNFKLPKDVRNLLPKRGNLVELAMGNGLNLRLLDNEGKFDRIVGFDYSFGMVRAANIHNKIKDAFYAIADVHDVPLVKHSSDNTIMCNALDRLRDPDRALREIRRIAKPDSTLVLAQCMPFQYEFNVGDRTISCLPKEKRIYSLDEAVAKIPGAKIKARFNGIPWHPVTVTQGRENLHVDVVVAKVG